MPGKKLTDDDLTPGPAFALSTDRPPPAGANGSATARESASASADVPEQFSVRVRPSTKRAIDGYVRDAKLKKGPATDALWSLLINGYIDVKMVRHHIRKMRGEDE
jgi:hypothetical protein